MLLCSTALPNVLIAQIGKEKAERALGKTGQGEAAGQNEAGQGHWEGVKLTGDRCGCERGRWRGSRGACFRVTWGCSEPPCVW